MSKQDSNGVRNAQDIERKYDFAKILGLKKNIEIQERGLIKINNELNKILKTLIINLKDVLDDQSEVSLWFYSGEPTNKNDPYKLWSKPTDHIGDIYYDQNTGYVYQLKENLVWELNPQPDLVQAMALTNSETDTSTDHERKVFFNQPTIPYSNGDWWIKDDGTLYICQLSKSSGTFESNDFIDSSMYTTTIAEKLEDTITVLKGCVTQMTDSFVKFTDLSTGGSTTIAGENIKTGVIQSNNYVPNKQGTRIDLLEGNIDTKNFKLNKYGVVECSDMNITGGSLNMNSTMDFPQFQIRGNNSIYSTEIYDSGVSICKDGGYSSSFNYDEMWLRNKYNNLNLVRISANSESSIYKTTRNVGAYGEIVVNAEDGAICHIEPSSISLSHKNSYTLIDSSEIRTPILIQTSKESEKKNFIKLENGLDILKQIDIYEYNFKFEKDNSKKHIGFVIGDNYKYSDKVINKGKDGVDIYSFVSVCCKAIQEQQLQIEELKKELNKLKEVQNDKNR